MPTVEFSTNDLLELVGGNQSLDGLKDVIPMLGVDLSSVGSNEIVMEVFPNRPDMLSIEGFARALNGFLGLETGLIRYTVSDSDVKIRVDPSVEGVRPHIACGIVKDVSLSEARLVSLMSVQEKLHLTHGRNRRRVAVGVHDLDKIRPPFTYKAVKPGEIRFTPLDMTEPLNLGEILKKHPKGRDYAFTLEGLDRYPLIVDRNNDVLSFPPIINGELTRVTGATRNLFIEATGLNQLAVEQAVNIVATSIADRGGRIYSVELN